MCRLNKLLMNFKIVAILTIALLKTKVMANLQIMHPESDKSKTFTSNKV